MAAKLTMRIETGVTWTKVLTYKLKGADEVLRRVSLSGWTVKMSIKDRIGGTEVILLSDENERIRIEQDRDEEGSTIGVIALELSDEDTLSLIDGLPTKKGVYDIKLTPPSGKSIRLLQGVIVLDLQVTD